MRTALLLLLTLAVTASSAFAEDERKVKLSATFGWGQYPLATNPDSAALSHSLNRDASFLDAFWFRFLEEFIDTRPGVNASASERSRKVSCPLSVSASNPKEGRNSPSPISASGRIGSPARASRSLNSSSSSSYSTWRK